MEEPNEHNLWGWSDKKSRKPHLIAHRCMKCGEIFFPKRRRPTCLHCQSNELENIKLSGEGTLSSVSVVMVPPAGGFYNGPVPYAYGCVNLEEGVRIRSHIVSKNLFQLRPGMELKLAVGLLGFEKDGTSIESYMFKPERE